MKHVAILLLIGLLAAPATAAEPTWLTSLPEAQAQAAKENKLIFLNFTGSDWCFWCKKLRAEVFSKPAFAEYARKHLVLVEVDFPRKKQDEALKRANAALKNQYARTDGFPTLVVLKRDAKGEWQPAWKKVGARISDEKKPTSAPEDPAEWIAKLEEIRK